MVKLSLWTEGWEQSGRNISLQWQLVGNGHVRGKGLCVCEHKDVCCAAAKLFLTEKRVNITVETAFFHVLCTVKHLWETSGLSSCRSLESPV